MISPHRKTYHKILDRAVKKLKRFTADHYVGYLTTAEVVVLCDHVKYFSEVDYYQKMVDKGRVFSVWFYIPVNYIHKNYRHNHFERLWS